MSFSIRMLPFFWTHLRVGRCWKCLASYGRRKAYLYAPTVAGGYIHTQARHLSWRYYFLLHTDIPGNYASRYLGTRHPVISSIWELGIPLFFLGTRHPVIPSIWELYIPSLRHLGTTYSFSFTRELCIPPFSLGNYASLLHLWTIHPCTTFVLRTMNPILSLYLGTINSVLYLLRYHAIDIVFSLGLSNPLFSDT